MGPQLEQWIGREERESDIVSPTPVRHMLALLDRDSRSLREGDVLPHGWHWLFCNPVVPRSHRGVDGHARRGDFLPPIPLPRRMWAGGSLRFLQPLRIGEPVERVSTILGIEQKQGRSGAFALLRIAHRYHGSRGLAVDEEQQLVYRGEAAPVSATGEHFGDGDWQESFTPDAVALFLFSALTMNGHRIHYDHVYATRDEGYSGLLVHAPFTALLLLDAMTRHGGSQVHAYDYRALRPLFSDSPVTLTGRGLEAAAVDAAGWVAMRARAG